METQKVTLSLSTEVIVALDAAVAQEKTYPGDGPKTRSEMVDYILAVELGLEGEGEPEDDEEDDQDELEECPNCGEDLYEDEEED